MQDFLHIFSSLQQQDWYTNKVMIGVQSFLNSNFINFNTHILVTKINSYQRNLTLFSPLAHAIFVVFSIMPTFHPCLPCIITGRSTVTIPIYYTSWSLILNCNTPTVYTPQGYLYQYNIFTILISTVLYVITTVSIVFTTFFSSQNPANQGIINICKMSNSIKIFSNNIKGLQDESKHRKIFHYFHTLPNMSIIML